MLSDEEKKAWDRLVMMKTFICYDSDDDYENNQALLDIEAIDTILNLIEKQSKEIELLKEENEKYKNPPFFDEDKYTENDKIKSKIEEYKKQQKEEPDAYLCIKVLRSLLEKE